MERTFTEISPSIASLLLKLAMENGFIRDGNAFVSKTGKKYIGCKIGFVEAEQYRNAANLEELANRLIQFSNENKRLKGVIEKQNRVISKDKNLLKVCSIVESPTSDKERIKQLKKYLNL